MNLIFKYSHEIIPFEEFLAFLREVEGDFVPPLLSRIDVESYYAKLVNYSTFTTCYCSNELVGLSASYDNNYDSKSAFVTFIAVKSNYRGNNIAGQLLKRIEAHARAVGMTKIGIDTNNPVAKQCYIKNGFVLQEQHLLKEFNLTRFYLEKIL